MSRPNSQYTTLQTLYDTMNGRLFEGSLPACIITLHGKNPRMLGFFHGDIYRQINSAVVTADEICLNPSRFIDMQQVEIVSTLLHEMVHLWQHHYGKPSRNGYHNKAWGVEMKRVGLYPSNSGELGGKETGQQMSHYIVPGGMFETLYTSMAGNGLLLEWGKGDLVVRPMLPGEPGVPGKPGEPGRPEKGKRSKVKYSCVEHSVNVWGKPGLMLAHVAANDKGLSVVCGMTEVN